MESKKIGRNDLCPCRSGKKYKKCCLQNENKIADVMRNYEEYDINSIKDTLTELNQLSNGENKFNGEINKARIHQDLGEHVTALNVLNKLTPKNVEEEIIKKLSEAVSYLQTGDTQTSVIMFDEILNDLSKLKSRSKEILGGIYLEAGKAYSKNGDKNKALVLWEKAAYIYKNTNRYYYARAIANIGGTLLNYGSTDKVKEKGEELINLSSDIKKEFGDLLGLSTNYCNLGIYYINNRNYQRALVYLRLDLKISSKIPNKLNLGLAYTNLAFLYIQLFQLKEARINIKKAMEISEQISNIKLKQKCELLMNDASEVGRECGKKGIKIGKKAPCACGSGKVYEECCGEADHEPETFPWDMSKIFDNLENVKSVYKELEDKNIEPIELDYILRNDKDVEGRFSWNQIEFKDGWVKYSELPDMANYHLGCAETLASEAEKNDDASKSLSCLLLSACGLEAFINQVAYFLYETKKSKNVLNFNIPEELEEGVMEFERHTEIITKWNLIGKSICGIYWDEKSKIIQDFKDLIYVRNELVHFKSTKYEQLIPPPKEVPEVVKRLSGKIEFREIEGFPLSWPRKIMTASLAKWSLQTADNLINYLKDAYRKNRIS